MMKIFKIILGLCFLFVMVASPVQSETADDLKNISNKDHYGRVDAVFTKDSRIVVNDKNFPYSLSTAFYDKSGRPIADIRRSLKVGDLIVFQYSKKKSGIILKTLQIITRTQFNASATQEEQIILRAFD